MNITKENIDDLNATISIELKPEDYEDQVNKILKDHKKKMTMPGFRPGMVPFGMVKKMYGRAVMAEEINKIISNELYKYIDENKLNVLGSPLPNENDEPVNFETQNEFNFKYDIGLSPSFEVKLSEKDKFDFYKIVVDDKLIERYAKDLRKRYGKIGEVEQAGEEDLLSVKFEEVNKKEEVVEDGISNTSTISLEYIEDDKTKKQLVGSKVGDSLIIDPNKVSKGPADMAAMLNIKKKQAEELKSKFKITVEKIYNMTLAEENQELYDKLFGKDEVKSKEDFHAKITEILEQNLSVDSDKKLLKDVSEKLVDKLKLNLPDAFLKRWLEASNENKLTQEQIEEEYDEYAKTLRWQLIENKIIEENELKIEPAEALDHAKTLVRQQLAQYGQENAEDAMVENAAKEVLSKEENARNIYQQVMEGKLMQLFKSKLSLKEKEVNFDEFVKIATGKAQKNVLDKISNLVKF